MKKCKRYILASVLLGLMSSCLEDDNNYNYTPVNELVGGAYNFKNFEDRYSVVQGGELTFSPTFKFTIDSVAPDVSYQWYLDKKPLPDETKSAYTFKAEKNGTFQVTFEVTDNKSGVKFGKSAIVKVRSIYQRGWAILSDDNGRSVLHFIVPKTVKYETELNGETLTRDSLVYHQVLRDVVPNLGQNPIGLINDVGNMDYYSSFGISVYDELVVKQDRWVELNGNTLEREVYTDEEFYGDLPENFSPMEAAMSYSSKAILDENGLIYWQKKANIVDFHAGAYLPIGINNNTHFSRLFQTLRVNDYKTDVMLALRKEDNSLVGILDMGNAVGDSPDITDNSSYTSGNMHEITDFVSESRFLKIKKDIIDAIPCPYDSYKDVTSAYPYWVVLLKDPKSTEYELRYFGINAEKRSIECIEGEYYEASLGVINDYRDWANFGIKRYVVIADGNQLYYYQYGWDPDGGREYKGQLMKLGEPFTSPIKSLSGLDLQAYGSECPYSGQLAIALEDGSLYIMGVVETKDEIGICTKVALEQLFPNETTAEGNKKFGNIVDVIYKQGSSNDYMLFNF